MHPETYATELSRVFTNQGILKKDPAFIEIVVLLSSLTLDLEPQMAEQFPNKERTKGPDHGSQQSLATKNLLITSFHINTF